MQRTSLFTVPVLLVALLACKEEKAPDPTPAATPVATAAETAAPPAPAPEPVKPESPIPDIPEGRSKPPTVAEWKEAKNINTQEANSQPDKCFMRIVREWLKVNCEGNVIGTSGMENFGTELGDYFASVKLGKLADYVVRLKKGKTQKLRIQRTEGEAVLFVNWPAGEPKPTIVALGRGASKM